MTGEAEGHEKSCYCDECEKVAKKVYKSDRDELSKYIEVFRGIYELIGERDGPEVGMLKSFRVFQEIVECGDLKNKGDVVISLNNIVLGDLKFDFLGIPDLEFLQVEVYLRGEYIFTESVI
jgi:hypothetical protein